MRAFLPTLLAATFSLSGCHVVERANQCQSLARVIDAAGVELSKEDIEDDPKATLLRKKARLYGQLAENVEKVHLQNKELRTEALAFGHHLLFLEEQLNEAAKAVDDREKYEKSKKDNPRPEPPRPTAAKTEAAARVGAGSRPHAKKGDSTSPSETAPRPARARHLPRRPTSMSTMAFTRRYLNAKRSAGNASRGVLTSAKNLERACR